MISKVVSGNAMEEYVVFNQAQITPLYLIAYDLLGEA